MWDDLISNFAGVNLALSFLLYYDHVKHEVQFFSRVTRICTKHQQKWVTLTTCGIIPPIPDGCCFALLVAHLYEHCKGLTSTLTSPRIRLVAGTVVPFASFIIWLHIYNLWIKNSFFFNSKFVKRTRREMITMVWPQKEIRQNKDTEKGITVRF